METETFASFVDATQAPEFNGMPGRIAGCRLVVSGQGEGQLPFHGDIRAQGGDSLLEAVEIPSVQRRGLDLAKPQGTGIALAGDEIELLALEHTAAHVGEALIPG